LPGRARRAAVSRQESAAGSAALAGLVSILRVTAIVAIVAPQLLIHLAPSALSAATVFGLSGWILLRKESAGEIGSPVLGNPFDLQPLPVFAPFAR
jgi:uncharacterized membrane protein (DUF4010 family)